MAGEAGPADDIDVLREAVRRDPAFATVATTQVSSALATLEAALPGDPFLLAAMALMALPGNGHSRLIPNGAIRTLPLRFVAIGEDIWLTYGAPGTEDVRDHRVLAINDIPLTTLLTRWAPILAGPQTRQRVIGAILCAWPAALLAGGVPDTDAALRFTLEHDGAARAFDIDPTHTVPGETFYPRHERGFLRVDQDCYAAPPGAHGPIYIRLDDFADLARLRTRRDAVAAMLATRPGAALILDLRGNPGGDFIAALPLLEDIERRWSGRRCALLTDKFTFSAALVFTALASVRLSDRIRRFGEAPGDDLVFYAEGGTDALPCSGAAVRWSDGHHDWRTGTATNHTPPEIATHLVAAGSLAPHVPVAARPGDIRAGCDRVLDAALDWIAS